MPSATADETLVDVVGKQQSRQIGLPEVRAADGPDAERTLDFPFSSEVPVARFFGLEVLVHEKGAINLDRLRSKAPLLFNHDPDRVIGVVEGVRLERSERRLHATVRFSRNDFAQSVLADAKDGIVANASFMYQVNRYSEPEADGTVRALEWTPYEVSLVSIPADFTVGIGRAAEHSPAHPILDPQPTPAPLPENRAMSEPNVPTTEEIRQAAMDEERARVAAITKLCRTHGEDALAQDLIERGCSVEASQTEVLSRIEKRAKETPRQPAIPASGADLQPIARSADIGLTSAETREFSFLRAIRAQAFPQERQFWEAAAFEREVSEATQKQMGMTARGILVPNDVLRRDLTVGDAAQAGDLVAENLQSQSFIEALRNRMVLNSLGMRTLSGLVGDAPIPKQTGQATAYWVGEDVDTTRSAGSVTQLPLTPHTVSGATQISRKLLLQSSIDVEQWVRDELMTVLGLEMDRAGIYGSGVGAEPLGIKGTTGVATVDFVAANPTYAEVVQMETNINAANADVSVMNYLTNAANWGGFKTTSKDTGSGQFIFEPGGTVNGYGAMRSNQVESGDVWFGAWDQLIMGMWGTMDIQSNPYSLDLSGAIRVTAFQDVDFVVRHPESFCRGNETLV